MGERVSRKPAYIVTAKIIAAYVANNTIRATDLPALIADVSEAIAGALRPTSP